MSDDMSSSARCLIEQLRLLPHPEGGWYRRTWQSSVGTEGGDVCNASENSTNHERPLASLIYFLLPQGDSSAWHTVDADELWLWHGPGLLTLELGGDGQSPQPTKRIVLGRGQGAEPQAVVPAGVWQRTLPAPDDVLVSCVVSPGFVFSGFNLEADL